MNVKKYQKGFSFVEHKEDLGLPLLWKKPKKIFVNSMSDLFHEQADFDFVKKCFFTMIRADWHTYQVLTKRPEKMVRFSNIFEQEFGQKIPHHIWLGVSVENKNYVSRIDELRKVQCNVRFISFEPLLDDVGEINLDGISWAIIGGESGVGFRSVKKEWISNIIKQCEEQNVAVFFKQWGGIRPKSGGRELDGVTYDEYPQITLTEEERLQQKRLREHIERLEYNTETSELQRTEKQIPNLSVYQLIVVKNSALDFV